MRRANEAGRAREVHHARGQRERSSSMRATSVQRSDESMLVPMWPSIRPGREESNLRDEGPRRRQERGLRPASAHRVGGMATELTTGPTSSLDSMGKATRPGTCYSVCRMLRALSFAGPFVALVLACASPTLPLPPPAVPDLSLGSDADHVKLSAPCNSADPNAVIVIVNTNTGVPDDQAVSGAIVTACGGWDSNVYAHAGDVLDITQEVGTDRSQPLVFQVTGP